MRPGEKGELIFESTTEARVASELLIQATGHNILTEYGIRPPLGNPRIGLLETLTRRLADSRGTSEPQEYTIADPRDAALVASMIGSAVKPNDLTRRQPLTLSFQRQSYMAKEVRKYFAALPQPADETEQAQ